MCKAAPFPWFNKTEEGGAAQVVLLRWLGKGSWGAAGPSRLQRELFLTKSSCLDIPGLFNPFSPKSTVHHAKCIASRQRALHGFIVD